MAADLVTLFLAVYRSKAIKNNVDEGLVPRLVWHEGVSRIILQHLAEVRAGAKSSTLFSQSSKLSYVLLRPIVG